MAAKRKVSTDSYKKVFEHAFGADTVDCRFQFIDENANIIDEYAAHRKVLAAMSPVFAVMFNINWSRENDGIVLTDTTREYFAEFMQYFYKGAITLTLDNVTEMIYLAHKYNVNKLEGECEIFIAEHLTAETVLKYYAIATCYSRLHLKRVCEAHLSKEYDQILRTDAFPQCDIGTLADFLRIMPRRCDAAMVFDSCIKWAKGKCQENGTDPTCAKNLRSQLGNCFELIHFKEMSHDVFMHRFKLYKAMFTSEESVAICLDLFKDIQNRYLLEPLEKCKLRVKGTPAGACRRPNGLMRFKMTKAVILYKIGVATASSDGKMVEFSANIIVYKGNRKIFGQAVKFATDKKKFTFPTKLVIDADIVHTIILDGSFCSTPIENFLYKRQSTKDGDFIPFDRLTGKESASGRQSCISSFEFIRFDD